MPVVTARPSYRCQHCQDTGQLQVQGVSTLNPLNERPALGEDDRRTGFEPGMLRFLAPTRFSVIAVPCTFCPPAPVERYRRDWEQRP